MLEKRTYLALLFDFYGKMLTEKQAAIFDLYYQCDLSLGEIAEEYQVSRQAVFDIIKRTENALEEYEQKLQLVNKYTRNKELLEKALKLSNELRNEINDSRITLLNDTIKSILEDS